MVRESLNTQSILRANDSEFSAGPGGCTVKNWLRRHSLRHWELNQVVSKYALATRSCRGQARIPQDFLRIRIERTWAGRDSIPRHCESCYYVAREFLSYLFRRMFEFAGLHRTCAQSARNQSGMSRSSW